MRFLQPLSAASAWAAGLCLMAVAAISCSSARLSDVPSDDYRAFQAAQRHEAAPFDAQRALQQFETGVSAGPYTIGPGDEVNVTVWGHEDLSGKHTIGPDGRISLPVVGSQQLAYLTPDQAGAQLSRALATDYLDPVATVEVQSYASNSVLVLGRVSKPGTIHFSGPLHLLDALAEAGTLPVGGVGADKAALNRCAIFRGRHEIVWINLKALLKGRDLSLNIRMRRGDIIYIPDADDQLIYVMGEVNKPGAYRLTPDMSFMDAVAQAGGLTVNGARNRVVLARPSIGVQKTIDINEYLRARGEHNYMLEEGDVIYVPQSRMAKVGYFLSQFTPVTQTMLFAVGMFK
ncbi:MAG TPA: polysaccharide biosynthesis/export family protein [Candidatus Binataceae bacterium]|nr:polysaccharide biosynthesis/export family protein [Candidatus Binataceae bacterium]